MTDDEIIALARRLGWNTEHAETNRMLIALGRQLLAWRRHPLTDDEMQALWRQSSPYGGHAYERMMPFARLVERAHGVPVEHFFS